MNDIYIFDFEVLAHDWLVVFKHTKTKEYTIIHNAPDIVQSFMDLNKPVLGGFNVKGYDSHILCAVMNDFSPEEVKRVNDWIIGGNNGWDCPSLENLRRNFDYFDLMDDCQVGLSLKAIEAHLGMDIEESEVDFNLDRPMTDEELRQMIHYCKADVDATEKLYELRLDYLRSKVHVGSMAGIDPRRAMNLTNARLTAEFLGAKKTTYRDERDYVYPENLKREYIPEEVFRFFDRMHDKSLTDDEVFGSKTQISIGETDVTIGYGGIHAGIPNYQFRKGDHSRTLRNYDVSSYYPSLMIQNGYSSRSIPSFDQFVDVFKKRLAAKRCGDKVTANALKLVLNTTYGATLSRTNPLYDPLKARSVCVSGQLYLLELARHLYADIPDLRVVELNTDGCQVEFDDRHLEDVRAIVHEWEERTHFGMEEEEIELNISKDVNNYVQIIAGESDVKVKGGMLVRGIAPAGAFNVNNNNVIIAEALRDYLAKGVDVDAHINSCDDMLKFQMVAKASFKYSAVYHIQNGSRIKVQKCNRVYASKDPTDGTLIKVHVKRWNDNKISGLPEHCFIDNKNTHSIEEVDKQWYIDRCWEQVEAFLGYDPRNTEVNMAEKKTQNVYQKLLAARVAFQQECVKKSGKNMHLSYKYFELDDIVPITTRIFNDLGLLAVVSFDDTSAMMTIVNTDNPSEAICFASPMREIEPIRNKNGDVVNNAMMRLGSVETYQRRYLYMVALDIVEVDEMEANLGAPVAEATKPAPAKAAEKPAPVSESNEGTGTMTLARKRTPSPVKRAAAAEERAEIKQELTNATGAANDLQKEQLKKAMRALLDKDPSKAEIINGIMMKTNALSDISAEDCEKLMIGITGMLG